MLRRPLRAALAKAGLKVSAAQAPESLELEQLVVLGPTLKQPARVAAAARAARGEVVILAAQQRLRPALFADAVVPLPLSPRDLIARLPQLLHHVTGPSPTGLASASTLVDPVTGFYVYAPFKDMLVVEVKRARRHGLALCVAMIGVDAPAWSGSARLQERVMAALALSVRRSLRDTDYAVQYSPDRVLVVMPHTELAGGLVVAERIRERVAGATLALGREQLRPTVSVGVTSPETGSGLSFADLARRASSCVEAAMTAGGNRVEFYDSLAPPDAKLPEA